MLSSLTNKPNVYSVWASQVAQWVKNLTTVQETQVIQVQSLGWEDPLEEIIATHSNILWSHKELDMTECLSLHFHATCGIFPDQGSNLCPLNWEHRVLTTGPPRKSTFFFSYCVGRISGTFFNMNDGRGFCLNTDHKQKFSMCLH